MSTVEQWSVWTARVYFEDQPEVFKVRPVVIYGNRALYGRLERAKKVRIDGKWNLVRLR